MTQIVLPIIRRLVSLFFILAVLTSCESRKIIVNGLDEKEANEILVFLANRGIDATKVQASEGGGGGSKVVLWNISVEASQATEAMAILNQSGLPRRRGQNLLTIFKDVGLVPSEMQEKIRYQAGLAEQIASTIRKIDGVLDADVQISFPEEDPLNPNAPKQKITGSVYVKHSGVLDDPNAHLVSRIKRLVSSSVNGLDFDNVTVIGDRARYSEATSGLQGFLPEEEKQYAKVWTITLAKESISRFRIIFLSFSIIILLLGASILWMGWKFHHLLKAGGGVSKLFSPHPFHVSDLTSPEAAPKEEEKEEAAAEEKQEVAKEETKEETPTGKDFDET